MYVCVCVRAHACLCVHAYRFNSFNSLHSKISIYLSNIFSRHPMSFLQFWREMNRSFSSYFFASFLLQQNLNVVHIRSKNKRKSIGSYKQFESRMFFMYLFGHNEEVKSHGKLFSKIEKREAFFEYNIRTFFFRYFLIKKSTNIIM